jgi:hypothetical protein
MNDTYVKAQNREAMNCGQMKMRMLTLASGLITSVLAFSLMLKVPQVHAQTSCNYYASPNGTGNGLSPSTPFQISSFWPVATPGKTLCLLDGTYTDGNSRILPPATLAGTASQPITIRALNDGLVTITGTPAVYIRGEYGIVEGINIDGRLIIGGNHSTVRRVVVYNNRLGGEDFGLVDVGGYNGLLEDCAVFGVSRKLIAAGASNPDRTYNTVRRCWARWEQRIPGDSPNETFEMGYAGQSNVLFENNIGTILPNNGFGTEDPLLISNSHDSQLLGSIAYNGGLTAYAGENDRGGTNNILVKDVVAISPNRPFALYALLSEYQSTISNAVGVSGEPSRCESGWSGCNAIRGGSSLSAALGGKSVWTEVPGICKRYVNGQLTNQPLWPWPMNQRIKDALIQSGRAPVDVTQTIESMLGPIPQACKTSKPDSVTMPQPRNLRVIGAN